RFRAERGRYYDHHRGKSNLADPREVFERIVGQLWIDGCACSKSGGVDQKRMTVGRRFSYCVRSYCRSGSRPVLERNWLLGGFSKLGGNMPRRAVGTAASAERNDCAHNPARICLGACRAGKWQYSNRRGEIEKLSASKLHIAPPKPNLFAKEYN